MISNISLEIDLKLMEKQKTYSQPFNYKPDKSTTKNKSVNYELLFQT